MFALRNCCFSRSECWTQPELSRASHILDGRAQGVGGLWAQGRAFMGFGIKQCIFHRKWVFLGGKGRKFGNGRLWLEPLLGVGK